MKGIITIAGFGTRFLPASKSIPKEMFPIAGIPLIQYHVESLVAAGITEIIIVVREGGGEEEEQEVSLLLCAVIVHCSRLYAALPAPDRTVSCLVIAVVGVCGSVG